MALQGGVVAQLVPLGQGQGGALLKVGRLPAQGLHLGGRSGQGRFQAAPLGGPLGELRGQGGDLGVLGGQTGFLVADLLDEGEQAFPALADAQ